MHWIFIKIIGFTQKLFFYFQISHQYCWLFKHAEEKTPIILIMYVYVK
jgi:hypothetical protein